VPLGTEYSAPNGIMKLGWLTLSLFGG